MLLVLGVLIHVVNSWTSLVFAEMQSYVTVETVGTLTVGIALVAGITQYLKSIKIHGKKMKVDPKLLAGIIALIYSALLQFLIYKDTTGAGLFTGLCNVFILTFGAVSAYEAAIKPAKKAMDEKNALKLQISIDDKKE